MSKETFSTTEANNFLPLEVADKTALYKAYMGFVNYGALFIPTNRDLRLGQRVYLLLSFRDSGERSSISGNVVWVTPEGAPGGRPQGVAVQFQPTDSAELQRKIEALLAGHDQSQPTYTL